MISTFVVEILLCTSCTDISYLLILEIVAMPLVHIAVFRVDNFLHTYLAS